VLVAPLEGLRRHRIESTTDQYLRQNDQ